MGAFVGFVFAMAGLVSRAFAAGLEMGVVIVEAALVAAIILAGGAIAGGC